MLYYTILVTIGELSAWDLPMRGRRALADNGGTGYLKSGVVFMEIFQMPIKENSVAASPNNELMIFQ